MKRNLKQDWLNLAKNLPDFEKVYHLVILPFFKEEERVIEESVLSIKNSNYPKEKMILVLAAEERGGERAKKIAKKMKEKFQNDFFKFFVTFHPKNLPGEIPAKGANVNYALNVIKPELQKLKIDFKNTIATIFDADTKPYPDYFSIVTFYFLKLNKNLNFCFQPIPVYNNNVWEAPSFSRVVATSNTFWQMIQQERPEQLVSYSSHSLPLATLLEVGYPKNVVSDDSRIFWKIFLKTNGQFKAIPLFYPVSMDAVLGKNLISTIISQYRQQRRWAFGVENIPYLLFGFLKNKKIPLREKIKHAFVIVEGFWSWAVASILIFILGWLPIILGGEKFKVTLLSYNLPILTRNLMILAMSGMVVCATISFLLLPPMPKSFPKIKKISILLQWVLLPLTLTVFGSLPALDAQTRLLFGKYLEFQTVEKFRKK